ncbi:hypothetical protein [Saccharomonospora glauca]|uniref:Uncharacterized protein n=1 Tax=Saccharomonospora glauca K62 TaxID=928724 RepID=I1D8G7_9PSEU|nr:hypothetical protein [Saccharomonospora glauca]EIF01242.1 hypothetical protein SacglDRAFT_00028 [Saccharomonospora glauca K62]
MSLVFLVIVSAYAFTGLVMDGAAAVRGKPLPSVLRREARQQARDYRRKHPSYLGTIWRNALDSWADASTRRHNRRIAKREAQEPKKAAEWVAKQIAKEERRADRRRRFAERVGVLWGKAREIPATIRERRLEDEAWDANARVDAERDPNVPAGLKGSDDLDDEMEGATVLPFRPRAHDDISDDVEEAGDDEDDSGADSSVVHDGEKPSSATDPMLDAAFAWDLLTCAWRDDDGSKCRQPKAPNSTYCVVHRRRAHDDISDAADEAGDVVDLDALSEKLGSSTTNQPDTGQDNPATKEEGNMSNAAGISGEINDLSSGIELARQMRRYITDLQNTLDALQATLTQTSTGLRQVPASLELASASLQTHGLNGPALEELTVARERASMVSSALAEAVSALSSVPDHLAIADDSFSRMEGELSSQLGISEQVGAAAARGGVARETDFYLRG